MSSTGWLLFLVVGLPLLVAGAIIAATGKQNLFVLLVVAAVTLPVAGVLWKLSASSDIEVVGETARLRVFGMYRAEVAASRLSKPDLFANTLKELAEFTPSLRTNGVGYPGRLGGWFRLRNQRSAFVWVEDEKRPVMLFKGAIKGSSDLLISEHLLRRAIAPTAADPAR
jgi:hypothetical protein